MPSQLVAALNALVALDKKNKELLTTEEWESILDARKRGVSWLHIWENVSMLSPKSFGSIRSLQSRFYERFHVNTQHISENVPDEYKKHPVKNFDSAGLFNRISEKKAMKGQNQ